jgi:hypothetical protein
LRGPFVSFAIPPSFSQLSLRHDFYEALKIHRLVTLQCLLSDRIISLALRVCLVSEDGNGLDWAACSGMRALTHLGGRANLHSVQHASQIAEYIAERSVHNSFEHGDFSWS